MLKSRWLSTFTVIGAVLIVLGIVGLILGPRFVYDPGQPVTGKEAWCYLAIGALMVLNGLMTPSPADKTARSTERKKPGHLGVKPAAANADGRAISVTGADKSEETRTI
jgi:hypothetical protein